MPRIVLKSGPYDLNLFCPFCGEQVIGSEGEGFANECMHTIFLGFDEADAEDDILESDVIFESYESAPASRNHIFVFREPG